VQIINATEVKCWYMVHEFENPFVVVPIATCCSANLCKDGWLENRKAMP